MWQFTTKKMKKSEKKLCVATAERAVAHALSHLRPARAFHAAEESRQSSYIRNPNLDNSDAVSGCLLPCAILQMRTRLIPSTLFRAGSEQVQMDSRFKLAGRQTCVLAGG
jgi:hypothetical protein